MRAGPTRHGKSASWFRAAARWPREALRLLDHHPYDLVLSDVRMPELGGPQLYDAIQQRCRAAMPAVVFMTGHVGDSVEGALQPGALILEKPFSLDTLCETVERLLATR